jgi:YggT family protein
VFRPIGVGSLAQIIDTAFLILYIMLFVRIILTWIPIGRGSRIVEGLFAATEPILAPIRRLVQRSPLGGPGMMIDFSPLIAFIILQILNTLLVSLVS